MISPVHVGTCLVRFQKELRTVAVTGSLGQDRARAPVTSSKETIDKKWNGGQGSDQVTALLFNMNV